ncbi:Plant protein of unknown function (DUF247) [Quillaja saponaria]|uniref:Uncharacterized protein n=1 Tax=Quillaja saponaria TaxID=32244 RepID=A0AAD7PVT5_QUISA|nr:Plant protein of unknown function (DUF247) [Quillaja saponaria]
MSHLVHTSGVKLTKDAILRDVLMLENQIPLVVLRKIFTIICSKPESVDEAVNSIFMSFCHALTPLPLDQNCSSQVVLNHAHLLDLMYQLILQERYPEPCEEKGNNHINNVTRDQPSDTSSPSPSVFPCRKTITGPLHFFKKKVLDPVLNYFGKLYGQMEGIGFLKPIKGPINLVLKLSNKLPLASLSNSDSDVAPVVVTIPSVTQLHAVGIKFRPASGIIRTIRFDEKTGTFYLPKVALDVNSEVIMRNLVAYEAMTKSEFLLFTRYTELIRAIVDTVEDIEVLVEKKIVVSHLDDNQVEKVFNGMSKSIGPTKTPILDENIEKVNKYYNGTQKVKRYRLLKKYVYSSWKICTLFATLLLLALISLQSFCSVYDCPRIFKTDQEIA